MFSAAIILCFVSANLALTPVEEAQYYKVYRLSDVNFEELFAARSRKYGDLKSTVEIPYNGSIPEDSGGNFGDLEFYKKPKNLTLLGRDTITNDKASQDLLVMYERQYDRNVLADFKMLNFGRERGWVCRITMYPPTGVVLGQILIAAGNEIRIFAEAYSFT